MHHKRTVSLGSVSCATMRTEDLIPSFTYELDRLAPRSARDHRKLIREANAIQDYDGEDAQGILEELFDALDSYSPEYVHFGAHEGDGADYGFWPSFDALEEDARFGEVLKVSGLSDVPRGYIGTIMHVSDHGNVTVYAKRGKRGKLHELWSCV